MQLFIRKDKNEENRSLLNRNNTSSILHASQGNNSSINITPAFGGAG